MKCCLLEGTGCDPLMGLLLGWPGWRERREVFLGSPRKQSGNSLALTPVDLLILERPPL